MKKLVLIVVSALLLIMFIGFNYLLWDRENKEEDIKSLEYSKVSNDASISALGREIKGLEDEKNKLNNRIKTLEESISILESERRKLNEVVYQAKQVISHKNMVIGNLLKHTDTRPMQECIKEWIEAIDKGNYETAYNLLQDQMAAQDESISVLDFTNSYKGVVNSIKIQSIELFLDELPEDKTGQIIFRVILDVKIAEGKKDINPTFIEGRNEKYVIVDYDKYKKEWVIVRIFNTL